MLEKLLKSLECVTNPLTNNPLGREDRNLDLKKEGSAYKLTYLRDGIDLKNKKKLEDAFYRIFQEYGIQEDKVVLMSKSSKAKQIQKDIPPQKQKASLDVGHGPNPKSKKRVPDVKKVIAVASGKGGVGKSTVAVNLAYALTNKGKKVGLLDGDIYGPSLPIMLGQRGAKPSANEQKKILPTQAQGLSFVSFGQFVDEKDPVIWRGPMLGGVLNQFLFDVQWGELDILIIDLPPGTGDIQLSMVQLTEIDGVIIVTTPQEVALLDSMKGLKMFEQIGIKILGLVENMSFFICHHCDEKHYIFGKDGGKNASKASSLDFLGGIPLEEKLQQSSDEGRPYMSHSSFKGDVVWKSYMAIADNVDKILFKRKGFFRGLLK